jgi:hypothetical protein
MAKKKYTAFLSPSSIDNTIKYLKENYYGQRAQKILNDILKIVSNKAVQIVKSNIRLVLTQRSSISTGYLENSVNAAIDMTRGLAFIRVNAEYGAFVEFGTGIKGKENPTIHSSQHSWDYDVHDHGEKGWIYTPDEGDTFFWTQGQRGTQFMLLSSLEIQEFMDDLYKTYKHGGEDK